MKKITLDHGSGGLASQELVSRLFVNKFTNAILSDLEDSAVINIPHNRIAFTTDSYVVDPIFFPGGNIGHLAVHGTINDLAMRGAMPTCLSLGMILEEGLLISDLERIADSIKEAAEIAQVPIVAGDTKVVPRGKADKIFINTSGIGQLEDGVDISANQASPGDLIILTGSMANHGMTILTSRAGLQVTGNLQSDTRALHFLIQALIQRLPGSIHTLRDPTRGGVGTTLWEIANSAKATMEIDESLIPIRPEVRAACELMGLDPLYLANEGTCLIIIAADQANTALNIIRQRPEGKEAAIIGVVAEEQHNRVVLQTISGGARIVEPLTGEPLPRIC